MQSDKSRKQKPLNIPTNSAADCVCKGNDDQIMLYGTDTEFITTSMRHLLKDHLVLLGAASLFIFSSD